MNSVPGLGFPAKSVDIIPSVFPLRSHSWTGGPGDVDALEAIQTTQHSVWQWLDCRHVLCVGFHLVNMCSVLDIGVGEQRL